jgi:pilus assembly protein CpaC
VIAKGAIPRIPVLRIHSARLADFLLFAGLMLCASFLRAQTIPANATVTERITVSAGMTHLLDLPVNIERVSVAAPETAEAVPVSARSLMINGKAPGETSVVIWLSDGSRREYDIDVKIGAARIEAARQQIEREFGSDVQLTVDNGAAYITGRVRDMYQAQRANAVAITVGRVVNLLKIDVPPQERQVLLKVRFADVDRSKSLDLGVNFIGAPKGYPLSTTTGSFAGGTVTSVDSPGSSTAFTLSDALNLFLFDPHLDLGATIEALASRNILQILAEPNLLAMNGKEASFLAGGEFPFPTLQGGGAGVGQVTVSFREFGIRIRFLPTITPRGTIRLRVAPEVSSLDYSNALTTAGGTVPALATRRVDTEIELQNGQSFAIGGLLNNQTTETLARIPGLADIPIIGKLFTSKSISKQNSELLVIVTPELVEPIPQGESVPELPMPQSFIEGPGVLTKAPRTPGPDKTGPLTSRPVRTEMSVQEMEQIQRMEQQTQQAPVGTAPANTLPTVGVPGVNMPAVPAAPAGGAPDASGR